MTSRQRVLVVDGLTETEEVLKAVLEPRGFQVHRVRGHRDGDGSHKVFRPNVVVIHDDDTSESRHQTENWASIPRVIIGSANIPRNADSLDGDQYLQKPFQYRELIQVIESLLAKSDN